MFGAMGLLSWIGIGLLAGAVGKFLLPGKDPGGLLLTIGIGIVGAVVGGVLSTFLGFGGLSGFDIRSFVVATLGSILFLVVLRALKK
jgi:uncharacterized membrane protein YeaQ/YmgE (transglycosylase-associated protein family)